MGILGLEDLRQQEQLNQPKFASRIAVRAGCCGRNKTSRLAAA